MNEFKGLVSSKTFWGALVAIGAGAVGIGHYSISPADQAHVVDLISGIVSDVGGLIAIYGRVVATKQIGSPS